MVKHFKWETLRTNINNHIKGNNFGYKTSLNKEKVTYINALATFKNSNTLYYSNDQNKL